VGVKFEEKGPQFHRGDSREKIFFAHLSACQFYREGEARLFEAATRREGSAMGRRSREHRERREKLALDARKGSGANGTPDPKHATRADELEEDLKCLVDGEAVFWTSPGCPEQLRESYLEDIVAFESVGSGTSLFMGLQENGMDLPPPEKLDEQQSAEKAIEVVHALADLRVFLIGYEDMTAGEFYSTLWKQTLWEGCYVEKQTPGAMTIIDVSHRIPRSEILGFLEELQRSSSVH
jgi:hypothetical protein